MEDSSDQTQKSARPSLGFSVGLLALSMAVSGATSYLVIQNLRSGWEDPVVIQAPSLPPSEAVSLHELNQTLVSISEAVRPSVVTVFTERVMRVRRSNPFGSPFFGDSFFNRFFGVDPRGEQVQPYQEYRRQGMGSGVIVSDEGIIITNNHVIAEADEIRVRSFDGQVHSAKVVGADPQTDVAILKIEAKNLRPIQQGNSDQLRVGEIVLAVGSPLSATLAHTVTQGIVSAKGRSNVGLAEYEDFIQTDADINPGNSGGALVNLRGELVGINTAIATRSGGSQGIGFAVPVNMAIAVKNSLLEQGEVIRAWLGVHAQDLTAELAEAMGISNLQAVLVAGIQEGSPAERAGIQAGDVITQMDSERVTSAAQLRNRVAVASPGAEVLMNILREGKAIQISVKLERLIGPVVEPGVEAVEPSSEARVQISGFEVGALRPDRAEKYGISPDRPGVLVLSVDPRSTAYAAGLREGDLIEAVNRQPVRNMEEFQARTKDLRRGQMLFLKLARRGGSLFIGFNLQSEG